MFGSGDVVINGNGVACVIDRMEKMKMPHSKIRKEYYVMHDLIKDDNVYYIPAESESSMRSPISKGEAQKLIEGIVELTPVEIKEERFRDNEYRDIIKQSSPENLVSLLKFFVNRKNSRQNVGKTLSTIDEKYMKQASRNLFSELSCSLELEYDEVERLVLDKISN